MTTVESLEKYLKLRTITHDELKVLATQYLKAQGYIVKEEFPVGNYIVDVAGFENKNEITASEAVIIECGSISYEKVHHLTHLVRKVDVIPFFKIMDAEEVIQHLQYDLECKDREIERLKEKLNTIKKVKGLLDEVHTLARMLPQIADEE